MRHSYLSDGLYRGQTDSLFAQLPIQAERGGIIATDSTYATTAPGVFSCGDARVGQSLIVRAISEGREAARYVDSFLRGGSVSSLPTKGRDNPFVVVR